MSAERLIATCRRYITISYLSEGRNRTDLLECDHSLEGDADRFDLLFWRSVSLRCPQVSHYGTPIGRQDD